MGQILRRGSDSREQLAERLPSRQDRPRSDRRGEVGSQPRLEQTGGEAGGGRAGGTGEAGARGLRQLRLQAPGGQQGPGLSGLVGASPPAGVPPLPLRL